VEGDWEYVGRLVVGAEPGRPVEGAPPRRCRGPSAQFTAVVPDPGPRIALPLRVMSRKRNDTNWNQIGSLLLMAGPSESTLRVDGFEDEYRFECDPPGFLGLAQPVQFDLYEKWLQES